ncbi:TPA: circularly permuted type 2 ATP-grasp protein [Klebsiella quasipneumoniae subsp. quasipneumoniae]|nr:circularly permuted type 2 ATP-grasp protein [Klebsiella quasipneumoniae subsp. quasipneumoniae]HBX8239871.1 hypothetical protein [Klebsiella pneumoniae]
MTSLYDTDAPACAGAYNEAFAAPDMARPHWSAVIDNIALQGAEGMQNRHRQAQRILRDDGATYNLNSYPLAPNVWSLDIIPTPIAEAEWRGVERGLAQRSMLFDRIFKDLYGEQLLLKEGIIPPEIVFSHPGFLRQCHGIALPGEQHLILHSVDLVRDVAGQFVVIGDRTQSAGGAGYVLENRTAISRVAPSLFRSSHVRRLSGFFHTLRQTLAALASHKTETPRIVVLTPGAYSSAYFEHAYLANYLGFPLVQGGDLTVRNGRVWLKSLNGLSEVDVILRRIDDTYCDQAELRSDSRLGVPGLLEVVRNGNVALANPLGSGVLETPALLAFLPQISQFLIGEPLQLPTVKTWWCGNAEERGQVLADLSRFIIKPAYRSFDSRSIYGHRLDAQSRARLIEQIARRPAEFVAQTYVPGSLVPIWEKDALESRSSIFRTFTVAAPGGYSVMPGSLSRVAESADEVIVSDRAGSRSKDTWIVGEAPDTAYLSLSESMPRDEVQVTSPPSRVIENLFWFGRYAERAEMSLRLLRTIFKQQNTDYFPRETKQVLLTALLHLMGNPTEEENAALLDERSEELSTLVRDGERTGSVKFNLHCMLTCAEQVTDMLSADTRIILNELRDHVQAVDLAYQHGLPEGPEESLDSLVTSLLAISGLNHESMLRGVDWMFQEIGRRAERARLTAILLKHTLTQALPVMQQQQVLESVLLSVEALISFRRRYRGQTHISFGLDLLMLDHTNPRSLIYQFNALQKYLADLPKSDPDSFALAADARLIVQSLNDIQLADLTALAQIEEPGAARGQLDALMTRIISQLEQFTILLSDKYFAHVEGPQQLANTQWKADL